MALKDQKREEDLHSGYWADPEIERLWAEEAERRYQDYLDGKEEAIRRARAALNEKRKA